PGATRRSGDEVDGREAIVARARGARAIRGRRAGVVRFDAAVAGPAGVSGGGVEFAGGGTGAFQAGSTTVRSGGHGSDDAVHDGCGAGAGDDCVERGAAGVAGEWVQRFMDGGKSTG